MQALARIHTAGSFSGSSPAKRPLVLVIEDEATQRLILRAALEREGFDVVEAVDGLDGVQAFDRQRPDIVLLDVRMPRMDGFETCAVLRSRPEAAQVPILMLTVLNDTESISRSYEAGATDFVSKPIAWMVLGHRLRHMLRASQAFNELARSKTELVRHVAERTSELSAANTELAAANKELEAFAYSVSHDLRAPLRAVRGFVAMLTSGARSIDAGERELLRQLVNRTEHMSKMIDDLLRFSSISRGGSLTLEHLELGPLVATIIRNMRTDYPRAAIHLARLPGAACDAGLIAHVFENLISNALKYSAKKEAPEVAIGHEIFNGESVFFVRDNGAGFDVARATGLFGVFRRYHATDEFPGTGVGLAIARRIIERHGGRIWVESSVGAGACFFFTLGGPAGMKTPPQRPGA